MLAIGAFSENSIYLIPAVIKLIYINQPFSSFFFYLFTPDEPLKQLLGLRKPLIKFKSLCFSGKNALTLVVMEKCP